MKAIDEIRRQYERLKAEDLDQLEWTLRKLKRLQERLNGAHYCFEETCTTREEDTRKKLLGMGRLSNAIDDVSFLVGLYQVATAE